MTWVNQQKEAGLFTYMSKQKFEDAVQGDLLGLAKDTGKIAADGLTVRTGAGLCASDLGCALGSGGTVTFALSDVTEGAEGLYNCYNGINASGLN
jgi:filamentous hemagglutinin